MAEEAGAPVVATAAVQSAVTAAVAAVAADRTHSLIPTAPGPLAKAWRRRRRCRRRQRLDRRCHIGNTLGAAATQVRSAAGDASAAAVAAAP